MLDMERREFIGLVGGGGLLLVTKVMRARAQQPAMPVIGFLHQGSSQASAQLVVAFGRGLQESGYAEGRNVTFEFRWADGEYDRLPELAADLVTRHVAVIAAALLPAARAAPALRHVHLLMNVLHRDLLVSARSLALKREQALLIGG